MSDKNNLNDTSEESLGFGEDELDLGLSLDDPMETDPMEMDPMEMDPMDINPMNMPPMDNEEDIFGGSNEEEDLGLSLEDEDLSEEEEEPDTIEEPQETTGEESIPVIDDEEDTGFSFTEDELAEEEDVNLMMDDEPEEENSDIAIEGAQVLSEYAKQQAKRKAEEEKAAERKAEKPKRAEERRTPRRSQTNPYRSNTAYAQYEKAKPQGGKKIVEMGQTSSSRTSRADMTVVGYGRTGFLMKFIGFIVVLACAFAVGFVVQYVAQYFDVQYMYAIQYLPLVNTAILLLYYLMFTVRSFNYRKKRDNDFKAPTPRNKRSVTYRKMNNGYYTIMRGLVWVIFTIVFDVGIIIGSNVLYGRLF